jgi:hypothetical protein
VRARGAWFGTGVGRPSSLAVVVLVSLLVSLGVSASAPRAIAQGREGREDVATLEKSLAEQASQLATSDCMEACRALASIRRAADKICALEPGERCAAAHAKAEEATRRVRDACPDCAIASAPTPSPKGAPAEPAARAPDRAGEPPPPHPTSVAQAESQGPRGGCRGCATARVDAGDRALGAAAFLVMAALLRRRRRSA